MKEHESRMLKVGESYKFINGAGNIKENESNRYRVLFVDSNNFLHSLDGLCNGIQYRIHGKFYNYKEWLFKREELLLQIHREEILNQL